VEENRPPSELDEERGKGGNKNGKHVVNLNAVVELKN
jgi:hypothetical protein